MLEIELDTKWKHRDRCSAFPKSDPSRRPWRLHQMFRFGSEFRFQRQSGTISVGCRGGENVTPFLIPKQRRHLRQCLILAGSAHHGRALSRLSQVNIRSALPSPGRRPLQCQGTGTDPQPKIDDALQSFQSAERLGSRTRRWSGVLLLVMVPLPAPGPRSPAIARRRPARSVHSR